jgi:hypothetical protein
MILLKCYESLEDGTARCTDFTPCTGDANDQKLPRTHRFRILYVPAMHDYARVSKFGVSWPKSQ